MLSCVEYYYEDGENKIWQNNTIIIIPAIDRQWLTFLAQSLHSASLLQSPAALAMSSQRGLSLKSNHLRRVSFDMLNGKVVNTFP